MSDNKEKKKRRKKKYIKPIKLSTLMIIGITIGALLILARNAYEDTKPVESDMEYTEFMELLKDGKIKSAEIIQTRDIVLIETTDGKEYNIINPKYEDFKKDLLEAGVHMTLRKNTIDDILPMIILEAPMVLFIVAIVYMLFRSMGSINSKIFTLLKPTDVITFKDVAGMGGIRDEVQFAIEQLKNGDRLKKAGARPCKGIILEGPPGTGKTLLAKAIAGEAGVPFISTSGSDFEEMFVGLGAARVRQLWDLAVTNAPCVVFIDEIDAIGHKRMEETSIASNDANQTLNALLQRMDGLNDKQDILVIGATNRIDAIDKALLRPGRFDKRLYVGLPRTKKDRDEIIDIHIKNKKVSSKYDKDVCSRVMFGLSGAEIAEVLNEAVLISIQCGRDGIIENSDIDKAAMKLRLSGVKTEHSSESDRNISAIHEAGHTVMNLLLNRRVDRVSISPYTSGVGGFTIADVDRLEGKQFKTKDELLGDIEVLLAGKVSEELNLGCNSIGCSNDLERATQIAFSIVNNFGMEENSLVNLIALQKLGLHLVDTQKIVERVEEVLKQCEEKVKNALKVHNDMIQKISERLYDEETILGDKLEEILNYTIE